MDSIDTLQRLMQQAHINSYRALAERAGVSRWQIQQLQQGNLGQMRLSVLKRIAAALDLSITALLAAFDGESSSQLSRPLPADAALPSASGPDASAQVSALQKEYSRLQERMEATAVNTRQSIQRDALDTLESWLIQWPTIVHRAQTNNSLAAVKVVKFVEPVMRLLEDWGVSAIAPVGNIIPYDPQRQQLKQGTAQPGDPVEVISPGYVYRGKLLHKTLVKPDALA